MNVFFSNFKFVKVWWKSYFCGEYIVKTQISDSLFENIFCGEQQTHTNTNGLVKKHYFLVNSKDININSCIINSFFFSMDYYQWHTFIMVW